ncbi:MAG: secondary thiamine-phosphate synthase enzyme YjbQ [Candidatus Staskawiczbacteria bacterium]|nr:secondary thiamine-phosphate synthase enzyme YjbQ [Candidatus Staskawiczbacteria bacterium]
MLELTVKTNNHQEIVDITEGVNEIIEKNNIKSGLAHLFVTHTTSALTTADLDPGTDLDMLDAFDELIPKLDFRHPHDPAHTPDHILSSLIGASLTVPVGNGQMVLGTWQRIILVEFNGPKERRIIVSFS